MQEQPQEGEVRESEVQLDWRGKRYELFKFRFPTRCYSWRGEVQEVNSIGAK